MGCTGIRWIRRAGQGFLRASNGNIAFTLALCALPLLLACGVAVDYCREITLKSQFDSIADTVALQAVDYAASNQTLEKLRSDAEKQFTALAQANGLGTVETLNIKINTDAAGRASSVTYTASEPPSVTALLGIQKLAVAGTATAHSAGAANLDIYVLADNTPSMGIGATTSDMATLTNLTAGATTAASYMGACAFACHISGSSNDYYTVAQSGGVTLRIDSVRNAINSLLDKAKAASTSFVTVRFALYTFGADASTTGLTNIYPLSSDLDAAKSATSAITLMSTPQVDFKNNALSDFTDVVYNMNSVIPDSGSGQSQAQSRKLFFFVSDGVDDRLGVNCAEPAFLPPQSQFHPLPPHCVDFIYDTELCDNLKARGITVAAIYTTFIPMPNWPFYVDHIDPMNKGPYSPSPNSLIAQAMQHCASPGYFQEVGPNDSISASLQQLFSQFVNQNARITG